MKRFFVFTLFILFIGISFAQEKKSPSKDLPQLLFFYSDTCHACHKTIEEVMPEIEKEFSGKISVEYLDIADANNYKLMLGLKEKYNCKETGVPTVFLEGKILVGYIPIKQGLKNMIIESLSKNKSTPSVFSVPLVDLVSHFLSFGILTIIGAGLVDGINPCAFTVIVFFISFLAFQGYRKKELGLVGVSFIFAVFLTYILIGLGVFRFLYAIRYFYLLSKILYYLIAILCFVLVGFCLYDIWLFKKTGKFEGITLQLPQIVKNRIHSIIGNHYRKSPSQEMFFKSNRSLFKLIISAFITGFLVSLLEAVCTGQLYLPTITFMLKSPLLRTRAFFYLILYNFMFVVPLFIVFLFALLGASSQDFARFVKKHFVVIRIFMAGLFIILGVFIILKA